MVRAATTCNISFRLAASNHITAVCNGCRDVAAFVLGNEIINAYIESPLHGCIVGCNVTVDCTLVLLKFLSNTLYGPAPLIFIPLYITLS